MYIDWTKHLKDPEEKSRFENSLLGAKTIFRRLKELLDEKEATLDRSEINPQVYDSPNWSERQAHKNGNREILAYVKRLTDLDQQKEP